jgi:uncharacterized protein
MEIYLLAAILLSGVALLIYMAFSAFGNRLVEQEVAFTSFPASFGTIKLFFISDIHRRAVSEKILSQVKGKADIVIIGGDLREKGVPLERVEENLLKLKSIGPVFFVWGNNDYEGNYHALDSLLLGHGVKILDNTSTSFESEQGERIILMGVDDLSLKKDRLDLALMDAPEDGFKVLISHNPGIIKKIRRDHSISFVLSGHTHGGQIRLFGLGKYKKGGIERLGDTVLLTSNGYGTTLVPLRLGAHAECHLISIKQGSE